MRSSKRISKTIRKNKVPARLGLVVVACLSGCTSSTGSRPSIWPTQKMDSTSSTASATAAVGGAIATTTKTVKGQFASMGTAVSSAYGKAKTAITSPFSSTPAASADDPSSLVGKQPSITPELHVAQGNYFEAQGNYTKAMDSYSKALEVEPKNAAALLSMAKLYDRQNSTDKAIEFYQKALASAPTASTFADLGNLYARNQNLSGAKEQLQKAVNLDPKNKSHRAALAGVLLDSGSAEAAMEELRQVETPAMANYQMAYLHFTRKNVPATQQYLASALQIDPNLQPARNLLASMGGAQNISQMAQQGQQLGSQAMGIYQQAGAVANGIQGAWNGTATPVGYGTPATSPAPVGFPAGNPAGVPGVSSLPSTQPAQPALMTAANGSNFR